MYLFFIIVLIVIVGGGGGVFGGVFVLVLLSVPNGQLACVPSLIKDNGNCGKQLNDCLISDYKAFSKGRERERGKRRKRGERESSMYM